MSKKECPSCAMEIDANETICPICQYEFPKSSKIHPAVAILLVLVMLFLLFYSVFS